MRSCSNCGYTTTDYIKMCPECGHVMIESSNHINKKSNSRIVVIIIGIACLILGIISIYSGVGNLKKDLDVVNKNIDSHYDQMYKTTTSDKCYITYDEFISIKEGMNYSQIKEIVGCEGKIMSESEYGGSKSIIYYWYGEDGISNANVMIMNDKCQSKAQVGLK